MLLTYCVALGKSLPFPRFRLPYLERWSLGNYSHLSVIPLAQGDLLWPPEVHDSSSFSLSRYLNNQVFVSLANGELVVYQREAGEYPVLLPTPRAVAGVGALSREDWALGPSLEMWLWATPKPSLGLDVLIYKWGC